MPTLHVALYSGRVLAKPTMAPAYSNAGFVDSMLMLTTLSNTGILQASHPTSRRGTTRDAFGVSKDFELLACLTCFPWPSKFLFRILSEIKI